MRVCCSICIADVCDDAFLAGTLNTMRVKEICRRQLLAKSSAATEKSVAVRRPSSSGMSPAQPSTPSFSAVASPLSSPANIAASPGPGSVPQRSPSFSADEQVRQPAVESLRPIEASSPHPSLVMWHAPAASCGKSVSDVRVHQPPRPASNSADSSDGSANQQFAVVSHTCLSFYFVKPRTCLMTIV